MKKSDNTSALRAVIIDDALRDQHYYLTKDDVCYFLGEYEPRGGFNAGKINSLILNYKKTLDKRGLPEYHYKEEAIKKVSRFLESVFDEESIKGCTVVPIPPSKAKTDPLYDDRLVRSLRAVDPNLDVREILIAKKTTRPHHEFQAGEKRPTPEGLYEVLSIDESCLKTPVKPVIILFDDLLTNGTHFKACKRLLNERLPNHQVIGLFIGRSKRASVLDDFDVIPT